MTRGAGLLFKTLTTPWKRALAQVLAGTVSNIGVNVGTQAATNIAEGKPAGVGLPGAARSGAVQGFIPGLVHGAHELMRPRVEPGAVVRQPTTLPPEAVPPPEATTGPKGGEIRGPTERTLEETRPAPPPPIEAHSDQNLEQRSIPPVRTPEEGERGMTEEEAHAYLDTLSNEIEQRHQARASDVGLIPRNENPHATVHDVPPPTSSAA